MINNNESMASSNTLVRDYRLYSLQFEVVEIVEFEKVAVRYKEIDKIVAEIEGMSGKERQMKENQSFEVIKGQSFSMMPGQSGGLYLIDMQWVKNWTAYITK